MLSDSCLTPKDARLATYRRFATDAAESLQGFFDDDLKDIVSPLANALAAARAEAVQMMATLVFGDDDCDRIFEAQFEKAAVACGYQQLLALSVELEGGTLNDAIDDIPEDLERASLVAVFA